MQEAAEASLEVAECCATRCKRSARSELTVRSSILSNSCFCRKNRHNKITRSLDRFWYKEPVCFELKWLSIA